jgi:hypothetical protein
MRFSRGRIVLHTFTFVFLSLQFFTAHSQESANINPDILSRSWKSKWITYPGITGKEFGVYLFRKDFKLNTRPNKFIVHVSADNRYKLYVNGQQVCNGPARGDNYKWYFETTDISTYLKSGTNVIAAEVWNFAEFRPAAQISSLTGFIMQGNTENESIVNTDSSWNAFNDAAYSPVTEGFHIIGPGEIFDAAKHPWDWMANNYDRVGWARARELENGRPMKSMSAWGDPARYILSPRDIPPMEQTIQRFSKIRRSGLNTTSSKFLEGKASLIIPASSKTRILIDQDHLTNAYPVLAFSKGKESQIKITYAESLVDKKNEKGNRNIVENKEISGYYDIVRPDGADKCTFTPLWFRTFRYIELEIETKESPLILNDFYSVFTGYPFMEKASFDCDNPLFRQIWNVGWRTQRLCAMETFFDCPYYEQLQYVGDTRIQALVSTYVSGDTRLTKKAIASIHDSRLPDGLTQSRYPSYQPQVIPPFSLVWNTMVYDYWMLNKDSQFIQSMIPGMMDVLNWYERRIDSSGLLGNMEWWNFVDWVNFKNWNFGTPPQSRGRSAVLNLQFVYTLQKTAALLKAFGMPVKAGYYSSLANKIKNKVFQSCWDASRGLLADTPDKQNFSQHANSLAILTDAIPVNIQKKTASTMLVNDSVAKCTFYFMFYLTEAIEKAGLAENYLSLLQPWKEMLDNGLTTFAEVPDPTRSDCHAWSSSPLYYFLSLVCGIKPAEPGFRKVIIEPHLGELKWIKGAVPHPFGNIRVSLKNNNQHKLNGEIELPPNLTGVFKNKGRTIVLKPGINKI